MRYSRWVGYFGLSVLVVVLSACGAGTPADSGVGHTVGGTVTGLAGEQVTVQNNGRDDLVIARTTSSQSGGKIGFNFNGLIAKGQGYNVTVYKNPEHISQECTVTNGQGTMGNEAVNNVSVDCRTKQYKITGTITGLTSSGLVLMNGTHQLPIDANATTFTFNEQMDSGQQYNITLDDTKTAPTQHCNVGNGTGTVQDANITTVSIICANNAYPVSGTINSYVGSGLVLASDIGAISISTDKKSFNFMSPVVSGAAFKVRVDTQPTLPTQICTVTNGDITGIAGAISNIQVDCVTQTYSVDAIVGQLAARIGDGNKLQLRLTSLSLSSERLALMEVGQDGFGRGSFGSLPSNATFTVSIARQPLNPWQTCRILDTGRYTVTSNVSATGQVTSSGLTIALACSTNAYTVSIQTSGLAGAGLVLLNNGVNLLKADNNNTTYNFTSPVLSNNPYNITVLTQPTNPSQACTIGTGGSGTVTTSNIGSILISCQTNSYAVGGTFTGLSGDKFKLRLNGGNEIIVTKPTSASNGTFIFPDSAKVASNSTYAVSVVPASTNGQPINPAQTCTVVSNGTGTVTDKAIDTVRVDCSTSAFNVKLSVSGMTTPQAGGTGLVVSNNGAASVTLNANTTSTNAFSVLSGNSYSLMVAAQPTNPWQTCSIGGATTGNITTADSPVIPITCSLNTATVGGNITGLKPGGTGFTGVKLSYGGSKTTTLTSNGSYTLPDGTGNWQVSSGSNYTVAIPINGNPTNPTQVCTLSNTTGAIANSNITNVNIDCTTSTFNVGGNVSGMVVGGTGFTGVKLRNGNDLVTVSSNNAYTFPAKVESNGTYTAVVDTQPTNPWQTCLFGGATSATGTVTNAAISNVNVSCSPNKYDVSGTITGLDANNTLPVTLSGNPLSNKVNGFFSFPSGVTSGISYTASLGLVTGTGSKQTCRFVNGGSGGATISTDGQSINSVASVSNAAITDIAINCTTNSYAVSGKIYGYLGSGLTLTDVASNAIPIAWNATTGNYSYTTVVTDKTNYAVNLQNATNSSQVCKIATNAASVSGNMNGANLTFDVACLNKISLGAEASHSKVYLDWNSAGSDAAISYSVSRCTISSGASCAPNTSVIVTAGIDSSPLDGSAYDYQVTSTWSPPSSNATVSSISNVAGVRPGTLAFNGPVNAIVTSGTGAGAVRYIGGEFTAVGVNTGGGVPLELMRGGVADPKFPKVDGTVYAAVPDGSGGWYIGGSFGNVGGTTVANLAKVSADGTVTALTNPPNIIYALSVSGTSLFAGGSTGYIAKFDISGATPTATAWSPATAPAGDVRVVATDADNVYIGSVTSASSCSACVIAAVIAGTSTALAPTGWTAPTLTTSSVAAVGVYAMALSGTQLYIGGTFNTIGAVTRNNAAQISTNSVVGNWDANVNGAVYAMALDAANTNVYLGGAFTTVNSPAKNYAYLTQVDTTNGTASAWNPSPSVLVGSAQANLPATVRSLAVNGGTLYVGGDFDEIGGGLRRRFAALDTVTGNAVSPWSAVADDSPMVIAISSAAQKMYVGGKFTTIGGRSRSRLASIDSSGLLSDTWQPAADNAVRALNMFGTSIYAGGDFATVNGNGRANIVKLDANGVDAAWPASAIGGAVYALTNDGTNVYAGGTFNGRIAAIDPSGVVTRSTAISSGTAVKVLAYDSASSSLYAGGDFTNGLGAYSTALVAKAWSPLWDTGTFSGSINSIALLDTNVYVGGMFTASYTNLTPTTFSFTGLASLSSATGTPSATWNPAAALGIVASNTVNSVATDGTSIFIGSDAAANNFAKLNAATGVADATFAATGMISTNAAVRAIDANSTNVRIGGDFTAIGAAPRGRFATFNSTGALQ
ncbi:MAG: hypothetical protein AABY83_06530 [Pseudomonadota bacterium]